jgi:acetyltransferase-like isoleucine patch superfamily enzyme
MTSYYSDEELITMGFQSVGSNVLVSRKSSIYGNSRIMIGNNVRIDDFCVISAGAGGIQIGNYVHIAVFASLQGQGTIEIEDFVSISSRVSVYSSNDDYFGKFMANPTVPDKYTGAQHADIHIGKHVMIGSGAILLPGIKVNDGAVVGALSLVTQDCEEFYIYKGNPAKKLMPRSRRLLDHEKDLISGAK